jgi:hypothetical protein
VLSSTCVVTLRVHILVVRVTFPGHYHCRVEPSICGPQQTNMATRPAPTPIVEWPDYSVMPNGGDVMTTDLNALYDKGDLCWMLVSTILCW